MSDNTIQLLRRIEDLERRMANVESRENPNLLDPYYIISGYTVRDDFIQTGGVGSYWAGWSTTPGTGIATGTNHMLRAVSSAAQNAVTLFLYKSDTISAGRHIGACVACDGTLIDAGLRMDDGTDNNYVEWLIRSGATGTGMSVVMRYREGGGAVSESVVYSGLVSSFLYKLRIACSTTSVFYMYLDGHTQSGYDNGYNAGSARSYTRHGVFFRPTTAAGRTLLCHWYVTNF